MLYAIVFTVVFVVLFFVMPKKAAIGLCVASAFVLLIGGMIYWNDYNEQKMLDSVVISMSPNLESCPADTSLQYKISNQTGEKLYRVYFRFSAYRKGYSSPVSKSYSNDVTENKIMESGESYSACIPLPDLSKPVPLEELEFRIEHKRVWDNSPML